MNPVVTLLLKRLPDLLPVVRSLLDRPAQPTGRSDTSRLAAVEQSLQQLAERSHALEAQLTRMRLYLIVTGLLSLATLVVVLFRI